MHSCTFYSASSEEHFSLLHTTLLEGVRAHGKAFCSKKQQQTERTHMFEFRRNLQQFCEIVGRKSYPLLLTNGKAIDPPVIAVTVSVNRSPLAGKDGKSDARCWTRVGTLARFSCQPYFHVTSSLIGHHTNALCCHSVVVLIVWQ